ncbi:MAG: S49 family peptidase [Thiohalospira sp.]
MPCIECENGMWRWGEDGPCIYESREECEAEHEGDEEPAGQARGSGGGYAHLASRVFNTPHLIHPERAKSILHVIGPRLGVGAPQGQPPEQFRRQARKEGAGYYVSQGVGVVDVHGTMVKRSGMIGAMSGLMGYEQAEAAIDQALNDQDVETLVLNIDSPGGEAAGVDALAERIYQARGQKRIVAVANDQAASAAYWIASAADEIAVPRTAEVGSIGVVMVHADMSGAAEEAGVEITHIYAGARKVDGTPWQPLSEEAQSRFQSDVDYLYGVFTETVARNRGMAVADVRATEALTYFGPQAVEAGLADRVETLSEVIDRLSAESSNPGGRTMSTKENPSAAAQTGPTADTQATTAAELSAEFPEAAEALRAEGAQAERERIQAIEDSALPGQEQIAHQLKYDEPVSADEAARRMLADEKKRRQSRAQSLADDAQDLDRVEAGASAPDEDQDAESSAIVAAGAAAGNARR